LRFGHRNGHHVLALAFEEATLYGVDQLLAFDAPPFVAGLDENVAVRVEVVAGLDGLDRKVVVDVGEPAVQKVAVEAYIDLTVLCGDVEDLPQIRR
jgi:hypothetical protein